mmetsp:Transcript_2551/g.9854  ORF Transcript_2551/g.9854 Transcript_2551/m.9854 type:complete len:262 (-) Transcript_2551:410-1195(-)
MLQESVRPDDAGHLRLQRLPPQVQQAALLLLPDVRALRHNCPRMRPAGVAAHSAQPQDHSKEHEQGPRSSESRKAVPDLWSNERREDDRVVQSDRGEGRGKDVAGEARAADESKKQGALEEAQEQLDVALPPHEQQRSVPAAVRRIQQRAGSHVEEHLGNGILPTHSGPVQGRHAVVVPGGHASGAGKKPLHGPAVALVACPHQRSPAVPISFLHAGPLQVEPLQEWGSIVLRACQEGSEAIHVTREVDSPGIVRQQEPHH